MELDIMSKSKLHSTVSKSALVRSLSSAATATDTETTATEANNISAVAPEKRSAIAFAEKFSNELMNDLRLGWEAKEKVQMNSLEVMFDLREMYQFDLSDNIGALDFLPEPQSKKGETGNRPFDKYSFKVPNEKGGQRNVNGSFYGDAFDASPSGKDIDGVLTNIDIAIKNIGTSTVPKAYVGWEKEKLSAEKALWTGRRTTAISNLRIAVALHRQFVAFHAAEKFGAEALMTQDADGNDVLQTTRLPIRIFEKVKGKDGVYRYNGKAVVSTGTFLSYDVQAAINAGGSYENLTSTAKKGADDKKTITKALSIDGFISSLGLMSGWLEQVENSTALLKRLNERGANKALKREAEVKSFVDLFVEMKPTFDKLKPLYDRLVLSDIAAAKVQSAETN
jgi:hypothetical protein